MKVILSCDDNPFYYDFWPLVKDVWKNHLGIDPFLVHISNEVGDEENVHYIKPVPDVPIYLQAQLARIYFTQLFEDEICLVSDIDMIPICKNFFDKKKIAMNVGDNSFYHLNPERREFGQLPLCYYCGFGRTYKKLFDGMSWEEFLNFILEKDFNVNKTNYRLPPRLSGNNLWFSDELFLHTQVSDKGVIIKKSDSLIHPRKRIDREQILNLNYLNLFNGEIIDIHLPRPYSDFKEKTDKILFALGI
tara:strand:+ start:783 stop:1523 length:741 start_codon:yes stop_codon:yes gene_type:complete